MIALLQRDLLLAVRAGGGFGLGVAFFLIVVVLVPLGIGPDMVILSKVSVGVLWVGALLACVLSLDRIFSLDYDDGTLELLLTSPIPLEAVVTIKAFSHWITTGLPLVVVSPILGLLLGLQVSDLKWVVISLLIGTPALSAIGAFGASLTVGIRRGGLLLSLLVLPLYVPTLIFGANVASRGLEDVSNNGALLIGTPALSAIGAFGASLTVGIRRGGLLLSLLVLPLYVPTLIFGANVASKGLEDVSNNGALLILTAVTLAAFSILPFASAFVLRINLR